MRVPTLLVACLGAGWAASPQEPARPSRHEPDPAVASALPWDTSAARDLLISSDRVWTGRGVTAIDGDYGPWRAGVFPPDRERARG